MKIVFDTNVLLSALLFPGFSTKVFDFCIVKYNVFSWDWLIDELEGKLAGKFKLSSYQTETYINLLREKISIVHPFNKLPEDCRDSDDNNVLQIAEYILADCIITCDKDLLVLEKYKQTLLLSPRGFFEKLHGVKTQK